MSWFNDDALYLRAASLWANGVPVSEIAAIIGVSKNALAGMAGRNRKDFPARSNPVTGLPRTPKPPKGAAELKAAVEKQRPQPKVPPVIEKPVAKTPKPVFVAPAQPPSPVLFGTPRKCQYPSGERRGAIRFECRGAVVAGYPYCAEHCAICYIGWAA